MNTVDGREFPHEHGLCDVCEIMPVPNSDEDGICAVCRVEITAACEIVDDPVERLLNAHTHVCFLSNIDRTVCRCGWLHHGGPGYHRRHVAEVILDALGLPAPVPWRPASDEIGEEDAT